jgi:predicted GNAT family acetyltransferase
MTANDSASSPRVRHDAAAHRFEIPLAGALAHLDYATDGETIELTHTFVPPELRGRGLAELLVRAALTWIRAEKKRVVPSCSYVATFVERHTEFRDLLAQ